MNMATHTTTDLSMVTALVCSSYVVLGDAAFREDDQMVSVVDTERVEVPGRHQPLCRFTVGCSSKALLDEKVRLYREGQLYVHPKHYDETKRPIRDLMRRMRGEWEDQKQR